MRSRRAGPQTTPEQAYGEELAEAFRAKARFGAARRARGWAEADRVWRKVDGMVASWERILYIKPVLFARTVQLQPARTAMVPSCSTGWLHL